MSCPSCIISIKLQVATNDINKVRATNLLYSAMQLRYNTTTKQIEN